MINQSMGIELLRIVMSANTFEIRRVLSFVQFSVFQMMYSDIYPKYWSLTATLRAPHRQ